MLTSTEILRILHFHLMQQAQMTTFQEKCGLDCCFFLGRLQCAATAGLQPVPVHQSALCAEEADPDLLSLANTLHISACSGIC